MVRDRRRRGMPRFSRKLPWARHRSGARAARNPRGTAHPTLLRRNPAAFISLDHFPGRRGRSSRTLGVLPAGSAPRPAFSRAHPSREHAIRIGGELRHRRFRPSPPARAGRTSPRPRSPAARTRRRSKIGQGCERLAPVTPSAFSLPDAREASTVCAGANIRFTCPRGGR